MAVPFVDVRTYGVLSRLLSEDYHDLKNRVVVKTDRPAEYMFNRIDTARQLVGMEPSLSMYPADIRAKLIEAMNPEAEKVIAEKNHSIQIPLKTRRSLLNVQEVATGQ
jgi:hypothetical protein